MAPPHKISPVSRSLVRIHGNVSDASARPLSLNLARTLTNTDGPLGPLVHLASRRTFVPMVLRGFSEAREARPLPITGDESSRRSRVGACQGGKRSREEEEEGQKSFCGTESGAARKNSDVRVSDTSAAVDAGTRPLPSGGDSDNSARPGCLKPVLKPHSRISRLEEAIRELQRKQEESKREKNKLREEVEVLTKKLATFKEIFQDNGKLKAVLKRLNITL